MIRDSLIISLLLLVIVGVIFLLYATGILRRRIVDTYKHKNSNISAELLVSFLWIFLPVPLERSYSLATVKNE